MSGRKKITISNITVHLFHVSNYTKHHRNISCKASHSLWGRAIFTSLLPMETQVQRSWASCPGHIAIKDGVQIWTLAARCPSPYSFCCVTQTEMLPNLEMLQGPKLGSVESPGYSQWRRKLPTKGAAGAVEHLGHWGCCGGWRQCVKAHGKVLCLWCGTISGTMPLAMPLEVLREAPVTGKALVVYADSLEGRVINSVVCGLRVWNWETDSLGLIQVTDLTPCSLCHHIPSVSML